MHANTASFVKDRDTTSRSCIRNDSRLSTASISKNPQKLHHGRHDSSVLFADPTCPYSALPRHTILATYRGDSSHGLSSLLLKAIQPTAPDPLVPAAVYSGVSVTSVSLRWRFPGPGGASSLPSHSTVSRCPPTLQSTVRPASRRCELREQPDCGSPAKIFCSTRRS